MYQAFCDKERELGSWNVGDEERFGLPQPRLLHRIMNRHVKMKEDEGETGN
jgi:hypothetical protein